MVLPLGSTAAFLVSCSRFMFVVFQCLVVRETPKHVELSAACTRGGHSSRLLKATLKKLAPCFRFQRFSSDKA